MTIKIGNKKIGEGQPCFIIAEISCNHMQKNDLALKLIEEAKKAGADAVKFQTYTPDTITLDVDNEYFQIKGGTLWDGQTLHTLYKKAYTPWEWFPELKKKAEKEELVFFSSPSDKTSVDFLEKLGVPAYKIGSFEINDIPLLKYTASKKKPIIISTGVSTLDDIKLALETIRKEGNEEIIVLKCTSAYPAPLNEMNLATIKDMQKRFGVIVGLSDHSLTLSVPITAITLGAKVIEKHFILERGHGSEDDEFSLEPHEFKAMVDAVRESEKAIGTVTYELGKKVMEHRVFMRSIFAAENIKKGQKFDKKNIRVVRPGHGIHPKYYEELIGKVAKRDIKKGTPLIEKDL